METGYTWAIIRVTPLSIFLKPSPLAPPLFSVVIVIVIVTVVVVAVAGVLRK